MRLARPAASKASATRRFGCAAPATLPDEIEGHDILAQAEPFADVTREAGTEITRAGAGDDGVDL